LQEAGTDWSRVLKVTVLLQGKSTFRHLFSLEALIMIGVVLMNRTRIWWGR
jgi:hypothetical protein